MLRVGESLWVGRLEGRGKFIGFSTCRVHPPWVTLFQGWTNVLSHSTLLPNVCTLPRKLDNHCQDHLLSNNHFYCFYTLQLGLQLATKKSCGSDSNPLRMQAWEPKPFTQNVKKTCDFDNWKHTNTSFLFPIPVTLTFLWLSHSWALVEGVVKNHTKQHDRC